MSEYGVGAYSLAINEYIPALANTQSYFGQAETSENGIVEERLLQEATTLLLRIAGTDEEDEQQSLLGQLIQLQGQNNELVKEIGISVNKLGEGGFVLKGNQRNAGSDAGQALNNVVNTALLIEMAYKGLNTLSKQELGKWLGKHVIDKAGPFLIKNAIKAGSKIPPIAATAAAIGGLYWGTKQDHPEWFDGSMNVEPPSKEELDAYLGKGSAGMFDKQDFIQSYGDNALGRSAYLSYLAGNNWLLYEQEKAITDQYVSFSEAEQMRIEKGLPALYPTITDEYALVPDAPTIKRKPSAPIGGISLVDDEAAPGIASPLTGAAVLDFPLPYSGAPDTQNDFAQRLTDALEQLIAVCAQPRVSVGTLAETAIIREEADLDALARRFADELLRAQLIS